MTDVDRCDELRDWYEPDGADAGDCHAGENAAIKHEAPKLWRATDLKPTAPPRWLAKGRLPRGAVSLIIGEEGIGKSLLWIWLAAITTTGRAVPEFGIPARAPATVIIAAITEDDWCSAVRPRLEVAGADLSMIDVICTDQDGGGAPMFPRDMQLLRGADPKPALIVVDAWIDTAPASLTVKDPQGARLALHPWKELAGEISAGVVLICHTNRVATGNARDRYGVTIELRKKARMSLYCQADEDGRLLVGPEKANGVATTAASLFTIEPVPVFQPTEEHDGTVPRLVYVSESDQTARQHLAAAYAAARDATAGGGDDAVAWLAAYLAAGPRWVADIEAAGKAAEHSKDKLNRAKMRLHVESKRDGHAGAWFWRLRQHQDRTPDPFLAALRSCDLAPSSSFQGRSSTSQDSKKKIKEKRRGGRDLASSVFNGPPPGFVLPTGPDRCSECGFHIETQGHRDTCSANSDMATGDNQR